MEEIMEKFRYENVKEKNKRENSCRLFYKVKYLLLLLSI